MEKELQKNCKEMVDELHQIFYDVIAYSSPYVSLHLKANSIKEAADLIEELVWENARLTNWKNDLLSGMYINCIYCGYRYGLTKFTPEILDAEMAKHIEHCPRHPLYEAKERIGNLEATIRSAFNFNTKVATQLNDALEENTKLSKRADNNQTCYASEAAEHERTKTKLKEAESKLEIVEKELQRIITDFSTTVEFWQNRIE